LMAASVKAETLTGTSCRDCSRRCAVTTTSSSEIPAPSAGLSAAMPGVPQRSPADTRAVVILRTSFIVLDTPRLSFQYAACVIVVFCACGALRSSRLTVVPVPSGAHELRERRENRFVLVILSDADAQAV